MTLPRAGSRSPRSSVRRMSTHAVIGFIFSVATLFSGFGQPSSPQATLARDSADAGPLAYVRTLTLLPVNLKTAPEPGLPPRPQPSEKKAVRKWDFTQKQ